MTTRLKIIFLIILLFIFIPNSLVGEESPVLTHPANIFQLLEKIEELNNEINETTSEVKNENRGEKRRKLSYLINKKINILESIPGKVIHGEIFSSFQKHKFESEIKKLEVQIDTNSRLGYDAAVVRDEIKIDYLILNRQIDSCCKIIKRLLQQGAEEKKLIELFEQQQEKLADLDLSRYEASISSQNQGEIYKATKNNLAELKARKQSFQELISFFSDNTMLLMPEYLTVGSVNLQTLLDRINGRFSIHPLGINPGKWFISISILMLTLFLYLAMVKISENIFRKYFVQEEEEESEGDQEDIFKPIHKPIGVLLILYAVEGILRIIFYPGAILPKFLLFFDLLKLAAWVWLAFVFIKTYGELSASQLLKHKDILRREIIGLGIKISYFIIVVIAIIIGLRRMDYDISAVLASLGIGGLAMALAARDTLANFLSSVTILISNPFSLGDWIETEAAEGTVVEVGLRQTTIRTFDNSLLFVPNSLLSDKIIRNWSRRKLGRRIKTHISLPNHTDPGELRKCVKEIRKMLAEHPDIANPHRTLFFSNQNRLKSRQNIVSPDDLYGYKNDLLVYIDELGPSTINVLIYCFSKTTDWDKWLAVKEEILLKIIEIIRNNDLKLAIPAQDIQIETLPDLDKINGLTFSGGKKISNNLETK